MVQPPAVVTATDWCAAFNASPAAIPYRSGAAQSRRAAEVAVLVGTGGIAATG
jgi:hypothetical protein